MKSPVRLAVLVVVILLRASIAHAIPFTAVLTGPGENPPNGSPGTGVAVVDLDLIAQTLHVHVSFTGLSSGTTASHIHCCVTPPGATGVATTVPTFANFPLGVMFGTYDNTLDLTLASSYNPAFVTANGGTVAGAEAALENGLLANRAYLNIHTTMFPGGEIRGFLTVPGPSSLLLLASGFVALVGLASVRWRQRG